MPRIVRHPQPTGVIPLIAERSDSAFTVGVFAARHIGFHSFRSACRGARACALDGGANKTGGLTTF